MLRVSLDFLKVQYVKYWGKCFSKKTFKVCKKAFFSAFLFFFLDFADFGKNYATQNDTLSKLTYTGKLWSCDCTWLSNYVAGFWEDNPKNRFVALVTPFVYRAGEMDFKMEVGEGHGTLKSIADHHGCPTRKIFEF